MTDLHLKTFLIAMLEIHYKGQELKLSVSLEGKVRGDSDLDQYSSNGSREQ